MESITRSTAVIIPAYNAENSLKELIERLYFSVGKIRVVVIDDGSIDRTSEIANSTGAIVLRHVTNRGKGAALQTGFNFIKNLGNIEFILTMDADLQHQPEDVPKFFHAQQRTGADIIIGWRDKIGTNMPIHRMVSNSLTSTMVGLRTGITIKDSQCGFRMIRYGILEKVRLETIGFEAETEFLIKAALQNFKIEFVPVRTIYGDEKSYMTHWTTTMNFIKVLFKDFV